MEGIHEDGHCRCICIVLPFPSWITFVLAGRTIDHCTYWNTSLFNVRCSKYAILGPDLTLLPKMCCTSMSSSCTRPEASHAGMDAFARALQPSLLGFLMRKSCGSCRMSFGQRMFHDLMFNCFQSKPERGIWVISPPKDKQRIDFLCFLPAESMNSC